MFFRKKSYLPPSPELQGTDIPKLSFCISHKNRVEYLQQTLRQNLEDNRADQAKVEFVLVDFGSDEDLVPWLLTDFRADLHSGYLRFFQTHALVDWHACIAKNTVHYLAKGAILVNLDCDNFTGVRGGKYVIDAFEQATENLMWWQYSKKKLDGTFGRIGMTRDIFHQLGGYDESFLPMGYQDGDLKDRALALGLKLAHDRNPLYNQAIKNEKFTPANMTWKAMNEHNERLSRDNIKAGKWVANAGTFGIRKDVYALNAETGKMEAVF